MFKNYKQKSKIEEGGEIFSPPLKNYLKNYCKLSEQAVKKIIAVTHFRQLNTAEILVKENEIFPFEIVLIKGLLRAYYINDNGEDVNINFFADSTVITPHFLRTLNNKNSINLQALEICSVALINYNEFQSLCKKNKEIMQFAESTTENELLARIEKERTYIKNNADKRLIYFRNKFPGFENRIAHYHIASYLNITPISLSRIRGKKQ